MKPRRKKKLDKPKVLGAALSMAWVKYRDLFGESPHGTLEQMTALVELAGGDKMIRNLAAWKP